MFLGFEPDAKNPLKRKVESKGIRTNFSAKNPIALDFIKKLTFLWIAASSI
jgi:hypothetical protein